MPTEQTLGGGRLGVSRGGVEDHLHDPFDVAVHRRQRADVHAQPARDGRAHGTRVQRFAFDGAAGDDVVGERRHRCLVAQGQARIGQPPQQQALRTADLRQAVRERGEVEAPARPLGGLPDVGRISAIHAEIVGRTHRTSKLFAAFGAAKGGGASARTAAAR